MRAFVMLYVSDFEGDDDRRPLICGKSRSAEHRAFARLASVCSYWHQTLTGWPQSPTSQWLKHQIKKLIERKLVLCCRIRIQIIYNTLIEHESLGSDCARVLPELIHTAITFRHFFAVSL